MLKIEIINNSFMKFGNVITCSDEVYHYILIETNNADDKVIKVNDNLTIFFSMNLLYTHQQKQLKGIFNVVKFKANDINKLEVFKKFETDVINRLNKTNNNNFVLESMIEDWIDVFDSKKDNFNSYIGIFGEYLLIRYIYLNYNYKLINNYQVEENDAVDFSSERFQIDCKTSTSSFIKFSLTRRQFDIKPDIAYVRLYRNSSNGMNLHELLCDMINKEIIRNDSKVQTILKRFSNVDEKFDVTDVNVRFIPCQDFEGLSLTGLDTVRAEIKVLFQFEEKNTKDEFSLVEKLKGE